MNSSLRDSMYGVMSYSQPCAANSAVQITSAEKTSHSPDLASWRCMNWLRCWPASAGNSTSLAERPCDLNFSLNPAIEAFASPGVSLPWQRVISPFAPSSEAGSIALEPSVLPVSCELPLPLPPLPPSPSSSPQPVTRPPISAAQPSHRAMCRFHLTGEPLLLIGLE